MEKIKIYENFLDDVECKSLLHFSEENPSLYESNSEEEFDFWDKRTLSCLHSSIPTNIKNICFDYLKKVETEIQKVGESKVYCDTVNFVKWWDGYEQLPHADGEEPDGSSHPYPWRKFGCVYYLNDDYEGGEIYFPNFDFSIKPKPNTMIFFPGDVEHLHGVRNVNKGTRHTIASFWGYDGYQGISI